MKKKIQKRKTLKCGDYKMKVICCGDLMLFDIDGVWIALEKKQVKELAKFLGEK